ncbi:RnfABCDGE type electron transport complex subunit D [candidate division KSB1 bacterium]|nr:RnfABCDGE type electron transport complex subunit D [candidate division KSB1 bacterium]
MDNQYYISSSPHIYTRESIAKIMFSVNLSLLPAAGYAVYLFGLRALWIMLLSIFTCVVTEAVIQRLRKKKVTVDDGSAILTGLLLAFNVSAQVPLLLPVIGSFFAIAVGKQVFGGLGFNPMNPALLGRAFLVASWPTHMTVFSGAPPRGGTVSGIDVITQATPLNVFKQSKDILAHAGDYPADKVTEAQQAIGQLYDSLDKLFMGQIGGCIGETSVLFLLIGAAFLLYKGYITWEIPVSYIGSVAVLAWVFGGSEGLFSGNILFHVLSGGLILGAFYMATDMVTSPITSKGQLIFGVGCGIITVLIRVIGGYPEGVSYSILLMNLMVPIIDRSTRPRVFGGAQKK